MKVSPQRALALYLALLAVPPVAVGAQIVPAVWSEGGTPGTLTLESNEALSSPSLSAYQVSRTGTSTLVWQKQLHGESTVSLPQNPFATAGFYRLQLGGASSNASPLAVTVVARPLARVAGVPLFGVNTHFAQRTIPDAAYDLMRSASVDLIRDEWVWPGTEKTKGVLQAPTTPNGGTAHQQQLLIQHDMKILHNCAYGHPAYDQGAFPTSAPAIAEFAKYCAFEAQQFGAALYGSEIWNESNTIDPAKVYSPLALATATALQHATPAAEILQGGGAGPGGGADPRYEEIVYQTIGASCCTGDSVHPYMTNPDVGYLALGSRLVNPVTGQLIVNMDFVTFWLDYIDHSVNKSHASHITELGWSTANDGKSGVSAEKQAAFISRTLIWATKPSGCTVNLGITAAYIIKTCAPSSTVQPPDLKSLFIYDFIDDGSDPTNSEHNFGLVHGDLTPKMSYAAFAQAAGVLRGGSFYKSFSFNGYSLVNAFLYKVGPSDNWLVLWTPEFKPSKVVTAATDMQYSNEAHTQATVSINVGSGRELQCREWDGHPCANSSSLVITNLPVFIEIQGSPDSIGVVDTSPIPPKAPDPLRITGQLIGTR